MFWVCVIIVVLFAIYALIDIQTDFGLTWCTAKALFWLGLFVVAILIARVLLG